MTWRDDVGSPPPDLCVVHPLWQAASGGPLAAYIRTQVTLYREAFAKADTAQAHCGALLTPTSTPTQVDHAQQGSFTAPQLAPLLQPTSASQATQHAEAAVAAADPNQSGVVTFPSFVRSAALEARQLVPLGFRSSVVFPSPPHYQVAVLDKYDPAFKQFREMCPLCGYVACVCSSYSLGRILRRRANDRDVVRRHLVSVR